MECESMPTRLTLSQAGFALCKGHDSLTMSLSNDRVYFPIAQSLTSIDDDRPLIDAHPVRQLSTPIMASITLPALLPWSACPGSPGDHRHKSVNLVSLPKAG